MPTEDDSREQGVEFGSLAEDLEDEEYPMENEELLESYGGREIDLQDGGQSLEEILDPLDETTYDSAEDVMQTVIGLVGDKAIGRKGQSDRGVQSSEDEDTEESI